MTEEWNDIPLPFPSGYQASTLGRIQSVDRVITVHNPKAGRAGRGVPRTYQKRLRGKILAISRDDYGYPQVTIPGYARVRIHILVAATYLGPRPAGMLVLHWDDDPDNNRPENLRYGTKSENLYDAVRNQRPPGPKRQAHH
jgi:hypothetical protein